MGLRPARKGQGDVAFGNIIGSNIFNILGILGATVLVVPMVPPLPITGVDLAVLLGSAVIFVAFAFTGARIDRREWNYDLVDGTERVDVPLPGRVLVSVAKPEAVARFERARADVA